MEHQPFWWKQKPGKMGIFDGDVLSYRRVYKCVLYILTRTSPKTQFARTKTVPNMYPNKISCTEGTSHINVGTSPKSCNFHFESSMREINIAVLVLHAIASNFLVQLLLILPPHTPRSGSLQQLALTSKKIQFHSGATIIVRPGKTGNGGWKHDQWWFFEGRPWSW